MGTTSEELKRLYSNLGGDDSDTAKTQSPVEVLKKIYEYLGGENPNAKNVQQTGDILNKFNEMDIKLCVDERFYPPIIDEVKGNPVTFSGSEAPLVRCDVDLKPQQDLHGYDKPWVGGAGKNKLPLVVNDIKLLNTGGAWTDNNYVYNGLTFAILTDDDNVVGIKVTGTASAQTDLRLTSTFDVEADSILNGCPANGTSGTYTLRMSNVGSETGSGLSVPAESRGYIYIRIGNGYTANLTYYPMLRLSTETDPTFEPYSNICPISGYSSVGVNNYGDDNLISGKISGNNINASGKISGDASFDMHYAPITQGTKYHIESSPGSLVYGFFSAIPVNGATSYDGQRVVTTDSLVVAPIDGYIAIRSYVNDSALCIKINEYTIQLGDTYYSGKLDVIRGILRVTHYYEEFDGTGDVTIGHSGYDNWYYNLFGLQFIQDPPTIIPICNKYVGNAIGNSNNNLGIQKYPALGVCRVRVGGPQPANVDTFRAELSNEPVQVVYEIATPIEIPLTPTEIFALQGINTMWTDGDSLDVEYITDNWNIFHPTIETKSTKRKSTRNLVLRVPIEDIEPTEEEVEVKEDIPEPTKEESIVKEEQKDISLKKSVEEDPVKEDTIVEEVVTDEQQSVRLS